MNLINIRKILGAAVDLVFPPRCHICGVYLESNSKICQDCWQSVPFINRPQCPRCGEVFSSSAGEDHLCGNCLQQSPPYKSVTACTFYADPVRSLLHSLKYQGDMSVLPAILAIVEKSGVQLPKQPELIVPVPLHVSRLRKRGFNQALTLARLLYPQKKNKIVPDALVRLTNTPPQTLLSRKRRMANLKNSFAVKRKESVLSKRICLVDDVMTTGVTAAICAENLLRAGAVSVEVIVIARTEAQSKIH